MNPIRELDVVRVISLEGASCGLGERYVRAPRIGDVAVVVMFLRAPKHADGYLCECVADDGVTLWLATFPRESIEAVATAS